MKGGKFLVLNYTVEKGSEEVVAVNQVIGLDPSNGHVRSWVFDTRGGFGEGIWTRHGDTWIVESSGYTADGRAGSGTHKWTLVDENTFTFQSLDREIGGHSMPDVKVTYTRVKKAK